MDRISALRNVEEALADFEAGDCDLATLERRVRATLRTYATDLDEATAYRAVGGNVDGVVVVAETPRDARERVERLVDDPGRFEVERYE